MRKFNICTILFLIFFSLTSYAQTFDGEWTADYVTPDDAFSTNSIGERVASVGAFEENSFVALVRRSSKKDYYLVGYKNANHDTGRLGNYPYSPDSLQTKWINFFDQAFLNEARDLATSGSLFYVANNDVDHNILMFELKEDSVYTHPKRFKTKVENDLWAIDVDDNGFVYVTSGGDSSSAGQILIYNSNEWKSDGKTGTLIQSITLPDVGSVRGVTVNSNGSLLYVSNWMQNKVYCYIGSPTDGYTLYDGFNFDVSPTFEYTLGDTKTASCGPWGLQFMDTKNILLITHDSNFGHEGRYHYGRVYFANPNTGEVLDTLDVAEWNLLQSGQYDNPDTNGTASGYTSVFNVDYDDNFNLYTTSYYGWAVDKWKYSTNLPTIELTITEVEQISNTIPEQFSLKQNYPNPFNPTTTIEFSLNNTGKVNLSVYTLSGELVTTLIESKQYNTGTYKVTMDASLLSSGVYFYTLKLGNNIITKKMTLLK
jgi:hypothetical protein